MEIKDKYLEALNTSNGNIGEIEIGESLYIDDETTRRIISRLLSEHKIEYVQNKNCNYRVVKTNLKPKN